MKQVERMHDSDARAAEAESEESRLLLERNVKTESQPPQLWLQPQRSWTTVCVSGMTRNTTQSYYSSRMNRQRSCARTHTQYWRYRKVQIRRTKCTFSFFFLLQTQTFELILSTSELAESLRDWVFFCFFSKSDCKRLRRRIHPNVIFLYDALARGVDNPEESGCICSHVCVRCGPHAPTLVLTNVHPALYFCTFARARFAGTRAIQK